MLNRSKIAVGLVAALSASALSGVAFAATQGSLGSTSTGTSSLNATVTDLVQITDVNDITLTAATASDPLAGSDSSVCVYSNASGNLYEITATSANGSGSFLLSDGSNTMAYTVSWTDSSSGNASLTEGAQSTSNFAGSAQTNCGDGNTSSVALNVPAATWTTSPAGAYTDTLTLVVAPN